MSKENIKNLEKEKPQKNSLKLMLREELLQLKSIQHFSNLKNKSE
jgi:hypothetical protein